MQQHRYLNRSALAPLYSSYSTFQQCASPQARSYRISFGQRPKFLDSLDVDLWIEAPNCTEIKGGEL